MAKDRKKKDKAPHKAADEAKKKKNKKPGKPKKSAAAAKPSSGGPEDPSIAASVEGAVRAAKDKVVEIATNPLVAEIVAATLVAAAAALRNPDKARQLASSAGDELGEMGKEAAGKGGAFWQLATDVARRTIAALDEEGAAAPRRGRKATNPDKS